MQREFAINNQEHLWPVVYTLLSMITRYWKIGKANSVVWDEVSHPPVCQAWPRVS